MTVEEKLKRCLEFIDKIEKFDYTNYDFVNEDDIDVDVDVSTSCLECGCEDLDVDADIKRIYINGHPFEQYVSTRVIDDLKDMAWHLKADITD